MPSHLNLLNDRIVPVADPDGQAAQVTLPEAFAGLASGTVAEIQRISAHQASAVEMFLAQCAAAALWKEARTELPEDPATWRRMLSDLSDAGDRAWRLVGPVDEPAFLQIPEVSADDADYRKTAQFPDELTTLFPSKNHSVKRRRMRCGTPWDWCVSLIDLQTGCNYGGQRNYGASRMNGGISSRPYVSFVAGDDMASRFRGDVGRLLANRTRMREINPALAPSGGLVLTWVRPWDGKTQIQMSELDPYYVDSARKVRLFDGGGTLMAGLSGSGVERIAAKHLAGATGDPFTPLLPAKSGYKSYSADGRGWSYRQVARLALGGQKGLEVAPMQIPLEGEDADGGYILLRALGMAGSGTTDGYHERWIPVPPKRTRSFLLADPAETNHPAAIAQEMIQAADTIEEKVLKPALLGLFQNGPEKIDYKHKSSNAKARLFISELDRQIDLIFFDELWHRIENNHDRDDWHKRLITLAHETLRSAETKLLARSYRASILAEQRLVAAAAKNLPTKKD